MSPATGSGPASASASLDSLAGLDAAVLARLNSLKDMFFRLELKRQAGSISEEEYAEQRAAAEKLLREMVRN
jgi:hypothetical protein